MRALVACLCTVAVFGGITSPYKRAGPNQDLPINHFVGCARTDPSCSEQVHLQLGGPQEMVVVYASWSSTVKSAVNYGLSEHVLDKTAYGQGSTYSQLMTFSKYQTGHGRLGTPTNTNEEIQKLQDTTAWARSPDFSSSYHKSNMSADPFVDPTTGEVNWDFEGEYNNPQVYYNSPMIHVVTLSDLTAFTTYFYTVDGLPDIFNFTFVPWQSDPSAFIPFHVGLVSDLGQTNVSASNVNVLNSWDLDVILHSGDLAYADGFDALWDSYGRMMQPLASRVPIMTTDGNHEVSSGVETRVSYNTRYPMPFRQSNSSSNSYWSRNMGPMHVIGLSSYTASDSSSFQFQWLAQDLQSVNRKLTPWVVLMMHVPWYNSNTNHKNEAYPMMLAMEDLFYKGGVDLVLVGHVHAYERTTGVYNDQKDICGPVYLTMGDGGNREGAARPWQMPQPVWSLFREASFGVGKLDIVNETHARMEWHRNACDNTNIPDHMDFSPTCVTTDDNAELPHAVSDSGWIIRNPALCGH